MRSRRHKLQVSTFPFLAVLLCAMGALLLVLLVMDRRAHDAARARAEQAAHRALDETAREAEERRAALEQARQAALAAWQLEHEEQHAGLERQVTEVRGEAQSVSDQIAQTVSRLRTEQDEETALRRKTESEKAKATAEEQALIQVRGEETKKADQSEASRKALAEMTADLAQLERTLADLKAAREKGQNTYSVVPYKGKRGEDRRPLYVECGSREVIFHPDRTALDDSRLASELQPEVERRLARQKEQLGPAQAAAFSPYLMLLVRPNGVETYYLLRDALRTLKIDFGYEFIDQDWALDFPDDGGPSQPWMTAAKLAAPPPALAPAVAPLHGVTIGQVPPGEASVVAGSVNSDKVGPGDSGLGPVVVAPPGPRGPGVPPRIGFSASPLGPPGGPGNSGPIGAPALPGSPSLVPGDAVALSPRSSDVSPRIGSAFAPAPGTLSSEPGVSGPAPGVPSSGPGSPSGPAPGDPNNAPGSSSAPAPGTPGSGPGSSASSPGNLSSAPGSSSGPAPGGPNSGPGSYAPAPGIPGSGPGSSAAAPGTASSGPGSPSAQAPGAPNSAPGSPSAEAPGAPNSAPGSSAAAPGAASSGPGSSAPAPGAASSAPPPSWAPTEPPSASPPGKNGAKQTPGSKPSATTGDNPDYDPFLQAPPPPPLPITSRPAPALRPARLTGDRDWIIYVECKPEGVVIYPTRLLVPASALDRPASSNPLPQTVQQLIDRKQATVKTGDPLYRPEVRFLVHGNAGRTYHLAYPTLDGLAAPKTAQMLGPDDDVATIVVGH